MSSDLDWLMHRCVSVSLECNAHRDYYMSAADEFADPSRDYLAESCDEATKAECIRRNTILHLHVYPDTPITFYQMTHWDLVKLLSDMRAEIERDRPVRPERDWEIEDEREALGNAE